MSTVTRDVHVVLVGLLANQFSDQFIIFFVRPKKIVWFQKPDNSYFVHFLDFLSHLGIRECTIFKKDPTKRSREWTKNEKLTGQLVGQRD